MKTLNCRDAGFDCEGKIRSTSEGEILSQAAEHAETEHNVQMTPELAEQLRTLIRDEKQQKTRTLQFNVLTAFQS